MGRLGRRDALGGRPPRAGCDTGARPAGGAAALPGPMRAGARTYLVRGGPHHGRHHRRVMRRGPTNHDFDTGSGPPAFGGNAPA